MTTEWRRYESSKINRESECSRCNIIITPSEPRYVMKGHDNRWIAMCVRCFSLALEPTARQERVDTTVQHKQSSNDTPYTPSYTTYDSVSRDERIARAHEENMESAKQTRNCLVLLMKTIDRLAMAIERQGEAKQ